jgi:putative RNA 2'-phosphotransferase
VPPSAPSTAKPFNLREDWYRFAQRIKYSMVRRKQEGGCPMPTDHTQLSKFLSFVLRHKPDAIGLTLDAQGWASIHELIEKGNVAGTRFDHEDLLHVVETSDKKRFSVSPDGLRIRAAQGHSVSVELGLSPQQPPPVLYHGTATRFAASILSEGLKPQARQQVHLSVDEDTARRVGQRHGKPHIFRIDALAMHAKGFTFYLAENGVWLTDHVPPEFLASPA